MDKKSLILITGGAGFVGSTLTNKLLKDNKVIVVDDLSMGTFENLNESENLVKIKGSVTDDKLLIRLFEGYDFDYVFHLAAVASVADSIIRPKETHMVNFDSTINILELLRRNNKSLKRFVFSSSAAVYGDEPTLPNAPIEAMRAGVPILATNVVGNSELVIEGKNSYLIDLEWSKSVEEKLYKAAKMDAQMIKADFRQRFAIDQMLKQIETIYLA
ncbi:NAD-dependent epimerase/dehydratase family protein [Lactococcus lactis]|uniref:NAD-dependent epimerase/dehydratase family protein n=1 Tax=Lactococcus lactis TaxID=1358 RepID=UPI003D0E2883